MTSPPVDPGVAYLLARAALVESAVRRLVTARRSDDPSPDDPFRGLYLSDDVVDQILDRSPPAPGGPADGPDRARGEALASSAEAAGERVRLRDLARDAALTALDVELLVVALLPDLDGRFERLYGYLNDDVTRRRSTVALALELAGAHVADAGVRQRLAPGAPMVDRGLLVVDEPDRPFLGRPLRVPDRVLDHLLGGDMPDPALAGVTVRLAPWGSSLASSLGAALRAGSTLAHLRDRHAGTGRAVAAGALAAAGREVVGIDLARVATEPDPDQLVAVAAREALLRRAGVVAGPVEALAEQAPRALRALCEAAVPVLLWGERSWDPAWSDAVPLTAEAPALSRAERTALWRHHVGAEAEHVDLAAATAHLVLGPDGVERAVRSARSSELLTGGGLGGEHLRAGARAQNAAGLDRLAKRVEPAVGWDDLVLPAPVLSQLRALTARARHRDLVLAEWRMRPGGGRGHGITALFAGDSGTGKTMSAEVIAGALGLDLYAVDLATVVDKYVGETEKNLDRIFREAAGVNAVLLFDEADAIFGKRSDVHDAHDRYANIESAFLLQRMESFDGLAVLATNLRANIDEAFTRRLDAIVDFPVPTEELRLALWQRCLAPPLPSADDLDLAYVARSFELAGGNIRSAAVTAAYLAAESGRPVGMPELVAALDQEYRKLGRLVLEREFGPYLELLR